VSLFYLFYKESGIQRLFRRNASVPAGSYDARVMPRLARVVVPGYPHHVTQRGSRRQRTFFSETDYRVYLALMNETCRRSGVEIWAYCLMPNHVHLVAVPPSADALRSAIGNAHRRYTHRINKRNGWRGFLWQGRFTSFVMDERYLRAAVRYTELNPVRAGIVGEAADYRWSSARAHLEGRDDGLVKAAPMLERIADWNAFLGDASQPLPASTLHQHEARGHPLGSEGFVAEMEGLLGRALRPNPRGRPRKVV